jgi:hypothetical protein
MSEYKVLNKLGYAELMLNCQEEVCFNLIDAAKSESYPDGDAFLAWKSLQERFETKTSSSWVLLKKKFNLCALKRTDKDPDEWIMQLLLLRQRRHQITDLDMVIHILNNLPREYESVIESLETDIDDNIHVDIEQVRAKL